MVPAVLRRRPLGRGLGLKPRRGDVDEAPLPPRDSRCVELLNAALEAENQLDIIVRRGPVQSRPAYDAAVREADLRSREAWANYADCAWGPMDTTL